MSADTSTSHAEISAPIQPGSVGVEELLGRPGRVRWQHLERAGVPGGRNRGTYRSTVPRPRLRSRPEDGEWLVGAGVGVVVAAVVFVPLAGPGWLQLLDWATGPEWPDIPVEMSPTSGPTYSLVTAICRLVGGAAVGWLVPALALVCAAVGVARLVGGGRIVAAVAAVAYCWNPFVFDRVYSGQVAVLLGYAVLPWLAAAVWRDRMRRPIVVGIWWAVAIGATVHFAWLGGVVVLAVVPVLWREEGGRAVARRVGQTLVVAAAISAVWIVPLRGETGAGSGTEQVLDAFGTRADQDLGRTVGLVAQQGFWRPAPTEPRDQLGWWFPPLAGATVAFAVVGLVVATGRARLVARPAAIAAGVGWVLAHGAAGPLGFLFRWAWHVVPGFAVMREAQKFVSLVALASAVGIAAAVGRLRDPGRGVPRVLGDVSTAAAVLLVVAFTPTLAGGLGDQVEPSRRPASVAAIRSHLESDAGAAIAVPWGLYVRSVPTDGRFVAAPARAWFGDRVERSEDPGLVGLRDDDPRSQAVARVLERAVDRPRTLVPGLRALRVRWVVEIVDPAARGLVLARTGMQLAVSDPAIRLWRVG